MSPPDQTQHLQLAIAQAIDRIRIAGRALGAVDTVAAQAALERGAQIPAAVQDLAQRDQQLIGGRVFHDVTASTRGQQALGVNQFVVHREHEHGQFGTLRMDVAHQFQSVALRERNVDDDDIRGQRANGGTCLAFGLHFAADDEIRLRLDHAAQALPDDRMIVDDQDAPLHRGPANTRAACGNLHVT